MAYEAIEFFKEFEQDVNNMKEEVPETLKGFSGLFSKIMKDGAVSLKNKELVALGIGLAIQCDPCIKLHVKKAIEAGASREEILEAASVSVMMGGGPAYTHIPEVIKTLDALGK